MWVFSFYHLLSVIGKLPLFLCRTESRLNSLAHIKIHNTLFGIVETSDLVAFFVIVILNELGNGIVDILVTTTERRGLFSLRLGESGSLCLVTLARTDSKHTLCCIHAILHILRIAQVLKDTLGESNAVLVDVNVRGSVSGSVDNLKVDVRKIDSHANSGKDYESLADEIQALSERKQTILTEEAESQGEKDRITEMMEFIENHADKILGYDEELVRLLVEKATIFENNVVVRFKSGIEIEV